jgi:hypothetical protein
MVYSAEKRVSHNLTLVWNALSIFVCSDRKSDWRIRESWPKAGAVTARMFLEPE